VQLLLGTGASKARFAISVDDAIEIAEKIEI